MKGRKGRREKLIACIGWFIANVFSVSFSKNLAASHISFWVHPLTGVLMTIYDFMRPCKERFICYSSKPHTHCVFLCAVFIRLYGGS